MTQEKGRVVRYMALGILVTPVMVLLAFLSAGAGHGDYVWARLFFPYSMLLTLTTGDDITGTLFALAVAQFPFYGLLLGVALLVGKTAFRITLTSISIVHLLVAATCFSGLLPNFS